jgi:hypothetical protein
VLRQELKSAAASRSQQVSVKAAVGSEISPAEKILVRALCENDDVRAIAREAVLSEALHEGWPSDALLSSLAQASDEQIASPMEIELNDRSRKLLASVLMNEESNTLEVDEVHRAIQAMREVHHERRERKLLIQIEDAARKGDMQAWAALDQQLTELKRARQARAQN